MDPFERIVEDMKPDWMKHPTHRWADAMEYAMTEDSSLLSDPYVSQMGPVYSYVRDTSSHVKALVSAYPEAYGAWLIASASGRYSAKWQIEAMMMAGADDETINDVLPMDRCGGKDVYTLYRGIFFDVDSYLKNHNAVLHSIFATSLPDNNPLSDCDVLWKMLAYELGLEDFDVYLRHMCGESLPDELQQYMHQFQQSRAMYFSMHQVNDLRLMYNESLAQLLEMARKHFKYDDEMVRDQEEKRISGCVKQLLGSVEYALLPPKRRMPPVEVVNNFSLASVDKTAG